MAKSISVKAKTNGWSIALWTVQIFLAVVYVATGSMKVLLPMDTLAAKGMAYVLSLPVPFVRFVGVLEILGALGMILPTALRVVPFLTPIAAIGFSLLQLSAIVLHDLRGDLVFTLPVNLVLLALALFVAWGRIRKAPIPPAARRLP